MNNSADEFRQSIEASLPPLTQYSVHVGAPGLYGAFGWGSLLAGSRQQEADSVRASADDGERSPSLRTSASLRSSFPPLVGLEQDVRDLHQPSVNLNGATGHEDLQVPASLSAQQYSLSFQQEQASPAVLYVNKSPTAPPGPVPTYNADAAVTVHVSPSARFYPSIPNEQGQSALLSQREELGGPYSSHSPLQPRSLPGAQDVMDQGLLLSRGPPSRQQSPNGKVFLSKHQQQHGSLGGMMQGKVVHMRRADAWTKYIAYEGCLQVMFGEAEMKNVVASRH